MFNADYFAYRQYRDYVIYKELARNEKNKEFKETLESLIDQEWEDFEFWRGLSEKKEFHVSRIQSLVLRFARVVLGLTFVAKLLEGRERKMIASYRSYVSGIKDDSIKRKIEKIIEHEQFHERQLIGQIQEHRVSFLSNIILGLNDGLIELTGALVGFSFALGQHLMVAMMGIITGIAAALSMASSAYLQALYENPEKRKHAKRAGAYTGIAYIVVVSILVTPFFVFNSITPSIVMMLSLAILIIGVAALYGSVLFDRDFKKEFSRMVILSLGVALISFLVGTVLRMTFNIEGL